MMRSEESARKLAETTTGNDETVRDAQPLSLADMRMQEGSLDGLLEDFGDHKGIAEAVRQEKKRRAAAVKKQQEKNHAVKQGDNSYGANNKLVSRERYEELKERMRNKLGGQLNMGIDPEILAIGTEMAAYHIEAGARKFADYAARMIADLGDAIRPYLKSFYNGARDLPEVIDAGLSEEMTPYEDVRKTDVANLGKDIPNVLDAIETIAKEQAADKQADMAKEKLITERNKQRKEEDEQRTTDTVAVASQAETVASQAESGIEAATTERHVNNAVENIDNQLEDVNKQLALLGYYEASPVERDYNEAYGYMRNAEKKAVKDANNLAKRLIHDLGIDPDSIVDKKGKKRKSYATANIAPIGGDITIHLPLAGTLELHIGIQLERQDGDNLRSWGGFFRIENTNPARGEERYLSPNRMLDENETYASLLAKVTHFLRHFVYGFEFRPGSPLQKTIPLTDNKAGNGTFQPGEKVLYKGKPAVVFEIDEDGTIALDTGNAPVMYEVAHKEFLEKFPQTNNAKENNVTLASRNAEKTTPNNNDYGRRNENPRTDNSGTRLGSQELPEPQHVGARTPVQDPARDSQSERGNAGVGGSELGTRPRYDVNRNYSNEEIGEIVSSVTEIVDGKVVLTGTVTDDIVSIARRYKSGGISKEGRGQLDEYYTDGKIVDAVKLLIAPYFKGGKAVRVLEPSVGVGNFLEALHGLPVSQAVAFEINPITARITKILNPNVEVNLRSFETEFMDENGNKKPLPKKFGLIIGNPPYGDHRGLYKGLGEESRIKRYEDYFVKRSLDVLEEGGVLAMVLPSSWIDRHTKYGGYTIQAAYRLPSGAFEATKVGTDIVILKKDSSIPVSEHSPYFGQHPERILGEKKQRKGRYGKTEEYVAGDIDTAIETIKRGQATRLANRLGIEETDDNINEVQAAIEETGSIDNAEALLEYARTVPEPRQAKKPKPATGNAGDKYKVKLNRKAEVVPASLQFSSAFSKEEAEAFADTYYDGTFRHPEKHGKYANYIGGKAMHDFYYAEGDIYEKLEQLARDKQDIIDKYGLGQYEKQKRLLESVLPKQKELDEIAISPNSAFVKNLRLSSGEEAETLQGEFLVFLQKLPYQAFGDSSYWEVAGYVRNEQVYGSDKNRNALIRTRRKKAANDLFGKFLHEELTEDERDKVVKAFNREYNSTYRPDYSKVPIFSTINKDFKGKRLKLTSVQLAGIGRMTVKGVGVLAHEVGFGKTLSGVLAMHEAMTRGYARRPLIVVPNNNILQQWVETIYEALPNATVNTLGNLGEKYNLDGFTVNDGEFTIVTYEGFKRLSFSDDVYDHLATKFSYITEDLNAHKSERDRQKANAKREETKGQMMKGSKKSYDFVDFGFDWLTFDEAHNANHIVTKVRLDKSAASDFRSQSQAKSDLGMKTWIAAQYIQERNNGRNVLLLSATPFTNKPLEYYSILSLVANDMLRKKGFFNVNTFFETFMEADNDLEVAADGRIVQKTSIRRFRNNGLFQQLLSEFIDIKGEEDNPDLVRPERHNKEYLLPQNELTREALADAQELLKNPATTLQGITAARMAAFSPYASDLFGKPGKINYVKFVENSPKINATVKLIEQNKKDRPDAGQIIYSEIGKDFFPQIREYLINKSGFKPEEVQIISGNESAAARLKVQEAYNNGTVKVIIGSGAIKEGMNLQKNTTDMYILSLPWNFTQLRQIEGRGWRQGNKWENIRINYMLTNDSIDVFMLQRLQTKQALYNEAMKKGAESVDVSDIDTAELKTALITNPETRADIVTIQERARLEQEKTRIEADLSFTLRKFDTYEKLLNAEKSLREDIERFKNYADGNSDSWFAEHIQYQEAKLQGIYEDIEEEKRKLSKKGIDVDDIQRKTDQARKAVASIEEKIERLGEYRQELVEKYRKEEEAKAEKQIGSLATYLNERATENKSGFYKIRPPKDGEREARFRKAAPATDLPLTEQEAALRDTITERLQEAGVEVEYVSEARLQELAKLSGAKLEAKRKSEARRKRDEQNHAIDHVTSLITGLTEKEARQERLRWEQQHRDLAKEIYEAALQGNFNDVTLQKINKYIDDATPRNTFAMHFSHEYLKAQSEMLERSWREIEAREREQKRLRKDSSKAGQ